MLNTRSWWQIPNIEEEKTIFDFKSTNLKLNCIEEAPRLNGKKQVDIINIYVYGIIVTYIWVLHKNMNSTWVYFEKGTKSEDGKILED